MSCLLPPTASDRLSQIRTRLAARLHWRVRRVQCIQCSGDWRGHREAKTGKTCRPSEPNRLDSGSGAADPRLTTWLGTAFAEPRSRDSTSRASPRQAPGLGGSRRGAAAVPRIHGWHNGCLCPGDPAPRAASCGGSAGSPVLECSLALNGEARRETTQSRRVFESEWRSCGRWSRGPAFHPGEGAAALHREPGREQREHRHEAAVDDFPSTARST